MNRMKVSAFGAGNPVHRHRFYQASNTTTLTTLKSSPVGAKRLMTFNSSEEVVLPEKVLKGLAQIKEDLKRIKGLNETITKKDFVHVGTHVELLTDALIGEGLLTHRFLVSTAENLEMLIRLFPDTPGTLFFRFPSRDEEGREIYDVKETDIDLILKEAPRDNDTQIQAIKLKLEAAKPESPLQKTLRFLYGLVLDAQKFYDAMATVDKISLHSQVEVKQEKGMASRSLKAGITKILKQAQEIPVRLDRQIKAEIQKKQEQTS